MARFAFRIVLASLSMVFLSTLVAYALVRSANDVWRTPEMPALPLGLVATTALLGGISLALERARAHLRRNAVARALVALEVAALGAIGFLAGQALNWHHMALPVGASPTLYPFTFYMLTGTHAAHVLGGLVPLALVIGRATRGEYSSSRCQGVDLCAQYWHYLGGVWLVILGALWLGS